jgi:hypothetical protein
MKDLRKVCFFCSKVIDGKKTKEHIIPNRLLGKLGIKEQTITCERITQYSRIKVPSHASCNNGFGSQYEERVLELLDDTDALYEALKAEEHSIPMVYSPEESPTAIITTWLSKIYYGFFYYDYLTTHDETWREICSSVINSHNFNYVRSSYENGHGFQLPSSLYVFKTENTQPDLVTIADPCSILIKINSLTIILCICDGYLTKNYLSGVTLYKLRDSVTLEDKNNIHFPSHKLALGEILALRVCIPKTPKFAASDKQIINMSMSTLAANPDELYRIDPANLNNAREEIFGKLKIEVNHYT